MFENKTGRLIRCPECFAKDIDVFLLYDEDEDEFYCYKCCFHGTLEKVQRQTEAFVDKKYDIRRYLKKESQE